METVIFFFPNVSFQGRVQKVFPEAMPIGPCD